MNVNVVDLFLEAGLLVQLVIILLLFFSIVSWSIIIQKYLMLKAAHRQREQFYRQFLNSNGLDQLYKECTRNRQNIVGIVLIFCCGFKAFSKSTRINANLKEQTFDSTSRAMRLSMNRELDDLEMHIPFLGTVGSVSPYIGLFGTVWGIMRAFISLGSAKQVTLQIVAPGIAEALIATAVGLFTAIPAVIAYNRLTVLLSCLYQDYSNFIDEFIAAIQNESIVDGN